MKWPDLFASRRQLPPTDTSDAGGEPPPREHRIAVVTDSAAALPAPWLNNALDRGAFRMVSMPVMIADEIFDEGIDNLGEALCIALAEGKPVRTSRPSPGQFSQTYQLLADAGFDGIVSVHISTDLSGTADAARLAASGAALPVEVVDSRTVGMAQGFGVQAALDAAEGGAGLADTAAAASRTAGDTSVFFYVPTLDQLRRGGRLSAAASWFASMLSLKPILAVQDGQIVPLEKVRTVPKAVARLEELALAAFEQRNAQHRQWAVHYFGNRQSAQEFSVRLRLRSDSGAIPQLTALPAVLAAHTGLGALVVVVAGHKNPDRAMTHPPHPGSSASEPT